MRGTRFLFALCAWASLPLVVPAQAPAVQQLHPQHHDAARQAPGTILVPASDFLANIPAGDSNDGRFPAGAWFFNNSTLNMTVPDDATASVPVSEAGTYHLFVRSIGTPTSSFKVVIDGKQDAGTYGHGPLAWQQGGDFDLKPGAVTIRLTDIQPRPSLNVLVLTRRADFKEDDLKALELPAEVKLLHEYTIEPSNIVKFGDVDGSGKYAILDITSDYSSIMYANDGHELWRWKAPAEDARLRGEFEAPGILWDFHGTGRDELAHWRFLDGKEWLVLADGRDGSILKKVPWPAPPPPHVYNNYRMAVAKFHPGAGPDTLLVLSDTGGLISLTAYDKDLNLLWQHAEHRPKDYFGHYIYPYDVNGDGIDEVIISHLCLDANGHEVWNNARYFEDNHDHMDAMEFLDINGDGKPELLVGQSDVGTLAYNAQNGAILWQNSSDHSQQVTAGWILSGSKTPQVVTNGRTYTPRPTPSARPGSAGGQRGLRSPPADQIMVAVGSARSSTGSITWAVNSKPGPRIRSAETPTSSAATGTAPGSARSSGSASNWSLTAQRLCSSRARSTTCSTSTTPAPSRSSPRTAVPCACMAMRMCSPIRAGVTRNTVASSRITPTTSCNR